MPKFDVEVIQTIRFKGRFDALDIDDARQKAYELLDRDNRDNAADENIDISAWPVDHECDDPKQCQYKIGAGAGSICMRCGWVEES